jgi:hypothetical protein
MQLQINIQKDKKNRPTNRAAFKTSKYKERLNTWIFGSR